MKSHRPRRTLKSWMVVLCIILIASLAVAGGTWAFLTAKTDVADNQFEQAYVTCQVNRSDDVFDVTNTGNIHAFIRAAIVTNWMDNEGNVRGLAPTDADVSLSLNTTDWVAMDDGYLYYTRPVPPGQNTSDLITALTLISTAPDGYTLTVEVVAEAIQAEGVADESGLQAALDAWGSDLNN